MTTQHQPDAGTRRDGTRRPVPDRSEAEERRALVLHIAADSIRQQWLRDHVAGHLDAAADRLEQLGSHNAAGVVAARARAHRRPEPPA